MATGVSRDKWKNKLTKTSNLFNDGVDVSLAYEGKRSELEVLQTEPEVARLLWQGGEINRLYYADNLPVLASLLQEPSIIVKVRLIYIDPPFATNSVFQSRSQDDAYSDLLVGSHYIEFLRERLAEDGSIYVHLDENMAFHIKIVMDEVFGKENFRNWITRKKCNPKNYTRKT